MTRRELAWLGGAIVVGVAIVAIYAWPGYLVWDAVEQLQQARAGEYNDWHPPMMAVVWRVLDHIVAGPGLMLVLQCVLVSGGLYGLLRRRTTPRRALIASAAIVVFPPMLALMGLVVKDSLMCGALLVAVCMLTSARARVQLASLALFVFAAALRHNALAAVIPLVAWLSPWPRGRGVWTRRVAGAVIGICASGAGLASNMAFSPKSGHMFWWTVASQDVVATLCYAPSLDDARVHELVGSAAIGETALQARACRAYDPTSFFMQLYEGDTTYFARPDTPERVEAMRQAWWNVLRAYPGAYVWSRLDRTREFLGLTDTRPFAPVYTAQNERHMERGVGLPEVRRNHVQRWLARQLVWLGEESLMFRPYVFVLISLVLLVVQRREPLAVALQLSSFGYLALLVFVSPGPDSRYAQWTITVVLLGLAMRALDVLRAPRARSDDPG